jgi:hypothetical protein
LVFNEI